MSEKNKNAGASPSNRYYGNREAEGIKNTAGAPQEQNVPSTNLPANDGLSGKRDQEDNADKHTDDPGNDDLDRFDMNSLRGKMA